MKKFFNKCMTHCGILPLYYDESLSYYETICVLIHKINELIAYFEGLGQYATEEYVDNAISDVLSKLAAVKAELEEKITLKLDRTEFETFLQELQVSLSSLQSLIVELRHDVNANTTAIAENFIWLKNYIDNAIIDLQVINPFTGDVEPIQTVLNYFSDLLRTDALTAAEYDGYELTATAYDALSITATQYDMQGKQYIN